MSQMGKYINLSAPVQTLTGDSGGAVGPDGLGNIDILGGTGIDTVGNPGTNSITIDVDATVATQYDTDAGSAIPALNILQVLGGTNMNTAGAGNTVTINLDDTVSLSGSLTVGTTAGFITAQTGDITATVGDIIATAGDINALAGSMTANVNITATTGNITATAGSVTAQTDITSVAGNLVAGDGNLIVTNEDAATTSASMLFVKNRGGGILTSGDDLGLLGFTGFDGATNIVSSSIISRTSGTIGVNQVPSNLEFYTHPDSAAGAGQRMVIATTGEVTINGPDSGTGLTVSDIAQGVVIASATGGLSSTAGTDGQVVIGATGGAPAFASLTSADGTITFTPGANTLDLSATAGGLTANVQTTDDTPTVLISRVVAEDELVTITATVNGFISTKDQAAGSRVFVTAYRDTGGNVTLVGSPVIDLNTTAAVDVNASVDTGTQTVRVIVTGIAAQTWDWNAEYNLVTS